MVRAECAADEKAPGISIVRVPVITIGVVGCGRVIPSARKWNPDADKDSCLGRSRRYGQRAKTQHGNQDHSEMLEPRVPCENGHGLPPHLPRPLRSLILLIRGSPYFYPQRGWLPSSGSRNRSPVSRQAWRRPRLRVFCCLRPRIAWHFAPLLGLGRMLCMTGVGSGSWAKV